MALSRLRLRLAWGFAVMFAAGLALVSAGALGYLWRESNRRLETRLSNIVHDVTANFAFEMRESPDSSTASTAAEVVSEWPKNGGSFILVDTAGRVLAHASDSLKVDSIVAKWRTTHASQFDLDIKGIPYRAAAARAEFPPVVRTGRKTPIALGIIAFSSTEDILHDTGQLLATVAIVAPIILLLSLGGGYLMSRGALQPVADLGAAVADIAPGDLTRRLPVVEPRDEVGALAAEFNALLTRLSDAQQQNRRFLREAAHQIRTPLTLVLGEAAHELATPDATEARMRGSLTRISLAAERMQRRVDELFMLAEAQTGEPVALEDSVELDELVLTCTDLMRPRATALGRSLALGTVDHVVTRGNAALLHEGALELLENAMRHGTGPSPVTVSVTASEGRASIAVTSGGDAFTPPADSSRRKPEGLGLPIVRWVAETHGGELRVTHRDGLNTVGITFPVRA